jgi:carbamoyl-phosphate synthase small subunit
MSNSEPQLNHPPKPAVLMLEDGTRFDGKAIGASGTTTGEVAFNTGMYGYQEIFTDPSYKGQVLVMATAHIGNYGVHSAENESGSTQIAGLVVRNFSEVASRAGDVETLADRLERDGIVGIADIDTRGLIQHIRDCGAMNALISNDGTPEEELMTRLKETPSMEGLELSSRVTRPEAEDAGDAGSDVRIALLDLGNKENITRCLVERGAFVRQFPMGTALQQMRDWQPHGWMISNGPGDPSAMPDTVALIKDIVALGQPVFGICLGHQLIALSQGLETEKMFQGHRGVNHPVKDLESGKCEITSQNHGFVVSRDSVSNASHVVVTHEHLNDGTVAGIKLENQPVFSVQFHPEASAGPHDSRHLFDRFIHHIKQHSTLQTA